MKNLKLFGRSDIVVSLSNTLDLKLIVINVVFFFICYELMLSMTHCKVLDQMNTENMHMGNTGVIQI